MKYDLSEESLLKAINECRTRWSGYASIEDQVRAFGTFEEKMAYVPRNKFFISETEQRASMEKRVAFLHVLEKRAKASGLFKITDEFVKDFVERND
jgi:hypothetical protein